MKKVQPLLSEVALFVPNLFLIAMNSTPPESNQFSQLGSEGHHRKAL